MNKRTRGPDLTQYCLNCKKFSKLILRKIIKIVATRCHILKLKCTKFRPDPTGGAYSAPQTASLILEGLLAWWRSTVVERRSLAGELSLSCARSAADG